MRQPKSIKAAKVKPNEEHAYVPSPRGLCAVCTGNRDMLGHVMARRRAAGKPLYWSDREREAGVEHPPA